MSVTVITGEATSLCAEVRECDARLIIDASKAFALMTSSSEPEKCRPSLCV